MTMLDNPSAYGADQVDAARKQGYQKLDDTRKLMQDQAIADASRRGVYNGTPLTNSLGNIDAQYMRDATDLETNLSRDQAQRYQQDRLGAINAILGYGQQQQQGQR